MKAGLAGSWTIEWIEWVPEGWSTQKGTKDCNILGVTFNSSGKKKLPI